MEAGTVYTNLLLISRDIDINLNSTTEHKIQDTIWHTTTPASTECTGCRFIIPMEVVRVLHDYNP